MLCGRYPAFSLVAAPSADDAQQGLARVKLADLYAQSGLTLSVEFFPPKTDKGEESLFQEIETIKNLKPAFCSVTYGAGGSTREKTVELVERIHRECGLEVMCHLTVVGQSKEEARSILRKLKEKGIENLLALGGDPPQGMSDWKPHPDGYHHAVELVREAVALGGFSIDHCESPRHIVIWAAYLARALSKIKIDFCRARYPLAQSEGNRRAQVRPLGSGA